jgi:predicted PurR-regulated permease PerM
MLLYIAIIIMSHPEYLNNNKLRQIVYLAVIIGLAALLFVEMLGFIPAALGAVTLYMLMRTYMRKLVYRNKWKRHWAALLLMLLSFIIILVPIYVLATMVSSKINYAVQHSAQLTRITESFLQQIEIDYQIQIITKQNLQKAATTVADVLPSVVGATFNSITTIFLMYFFLYFMLVSGVEMERWLYRFLPLHNSNIKRMGTQLDALVKSNAIGMPLIAIAQGLVGLLGYLIFGANDPLFWCVLTALASMVPFVGSALAYIPLGLIMLAESTWRGVGILAWGFLVIGVTDNVFRIWFQRKMGDTHPLITMLGVIIGVPMFGFIGLIFGPILIAMFLLIVQVYIDEFGHINADYDPTQHDVEKM